MPGVEVARGDIRDGPRVTRACEGVDTVFHLAAFISIDGPHGGLVEQVNAGGAANIVRACLHAGVRRLVHMSSIHALEPERVDEVIDESRALTSRPAAYDSSKAMAERHVLAGVARGLDAVVVNPVAVIGPEDHRPSLTGEMIRRLMKNELPGLVEAGFPWVDARDVVAATLAAERRGKTGERYILMGEYATARRLADLVSEFSGTVAPRFSSPMWLARASAPVMTAISRMRGERPLFTTESLDTLCRYQRIDAQKARRDLGFSPRPLADTIRDTVLWFRERGLA